MYNYTSWNACLFCYMTHPSWISMAYQAMMYINKVTVTFKHSLAFIHCSTERLLSLEKAPTQRCIVVHCRLWNESWWHFTLTSKMALLCGLHEGGGLAALCFVCFYCPCSFFIHRLSTMTSMCNISAECKLCFGLYVACMESEMELALAWLIKSSWVVQCLADGPTSTGRQACSRAEPLNFRNDWTLVATERTGREAASGSGSGWHQATAAGYATLKQHKVDELRSQVRPSY